MNEENIEQPKKVEEEVKAQKKEPKVQKIEPSKTLVDALNRFQELNISALKSTDNTFFKSTYADLTSVIDAVNQGAKYGLCFTQQVQYKNMVLDKQMVDNLKDGTTNNNAEKDNPQKMGSAITYAKRYGLQALFGLGQDDDANEATGNKGVKNG